MAWIYFNYGGQGLLAPAVIDKIRENYAYIETLGAFSHGANDWIASELAETRSVLAHLLGTTPETITLTQNTTEGCNIALWSYPWRAGDHLLLSDCEHPGVVAIAAALSQRLGVKFSFFPLFDYRDRGEVEVLALLAEHLQPQTKMVMVSHICWNTGQILPLQSIAQLCHDRGIWLAVDAAQSVGVLPLQLEELGVDFYAFTGHKWLNGPLGLGGLYVAPRVQEEALVTFVGWRGLKQKQAKFEVASSAYPLLGALRLALELANQGGTTTERYQRIGQNAQHLWARLTSLPGINTVCASPPRSGLVPFQVANFSPLALSRLLEEKYRICLRSIPHPPALRASVSYSTSPEDIEQLVAVLAQELKGQGN
ncbi:MAG: aminotransferase class V-fold PLP-dependent enzyme [Pseudanabaenaceae cyanobacterium SKYGB_i_bin29]|nr:aminotransferase class V-fold PLP-dependent enzyme [Pseudanabaenaceae cyanobacterium SKYG29]MDW8421954.1 aminotransferase class V-fold PLP-dependent enzyme [Pseudanabaenaceae cyanobacterium SKYGB_i_bin29]